MDTSKIWSGTITMDMTTLNFIVCSIAGFSCLFVLVTNKVDTRHWRRLFIVCFTGLAFTIWLISGIVHGTVRPENVAGRAIVLVAFLIWVMELYEFNVISYVRHLRRTVRRKRNVS